MKKSCEKCQEVAEVYAIGAGSGDWGGYYCQTHIPAGFRVVDRFESCHPQYDFDFLATRCANTQKWIEDCDCFRVAKVKLTT